MFYEQLIQLCEKNNEKPTPLLKALGLSPGNIERWKNGSTVNSDILIAISDHFNVSVDYLLKGTASSTPTLSPEPDELEQKVISFCEELGIGPSVSRKMIVESVRVAVQQKSK